MTLFKKRISIRLTNDDSFIVSVRHGWFTTSKMFHVGLIPLRVAAMIRPADSADGKHDQAQRRFSEE